MVRISLGLILVLGLLSAVPSEHAAADGVSIHDPNPGFENVLYAVDGSSAQDVWAVGSTRKAGPPETFIVHWDGRTWSRVPSPNGGPAAGGNYLQAVSVDSATDAWA